MSALKYYLTSRIGTREVHPLNTKNLDIVWGKEGNRSELVKSLSGKMLFGGEDFYWINILEKLTYRCDPLILEIKKKCNADLETIYTGNVSLNSGAPWNLDKCTVSLSVQKSDKYQCFEDSSDIDIDLFSVIPARKSVSHLIGVIEYHIVTETIASEDPFNNFPGEANPASKGWIELSETRKSNAEDRNYTAIWVRENNGAVLPVNGSTWVLDGADYVRQPALYGFKQDPSDGNYPLDYGYYYNIFDFPIDNGLDLFEVMSFFVGYQCPGLKLQSEFFQWSPKVATAINYVTGATSKVLNLVLFQKSDVKRPLDTNNANKFITNFGDVLADICNEFQLEWEITEDLEFKIEHVSFKNRVAGVDTTHEPLNRGSRRYTYENDSLPRKEVFTSMESSPGDFAGTPIIYSGSCANIGDNKETTIQVKTITTDVLLCLNNPTPDGAVSDEGAVLVAINVDGKILSENSILGGNIVNNTLAWAQLQKDYYRHNRPQKVFTMNTLKQQALTIKPTKLQENLKLFLCCGSEEFLPDELIKTSLGDNGILKSAKFNLMSEMIQLSVLFPSDDNLVQNEAPHVEPESITTYKNTPITIDVLANDIDRDGNIDPSTLRIVTQPTNGTAVVTSEFKVLYTPNTDYTGVDYIIYSVKDKFGEPSLNGYSPVIIEEGSALPIANTDTYQMANNRTLVVGATGVMANDVPVGSISVTPETKATDNGGSITLFANGSFEYTPPAADYVGLDQTTYELNDGAETSEGTVKFVIFDSSPVYAKLQKANLDNSSIIDYCSGRGQSLVGSKKTARYKLSFYSDADMSTPLNIFGYGLSFNIQEVQTDNSDNSIISDTTTAFPVLSGKEAIYENEKIVEYQYFGCDNILTDNYSIELSLIAGTGYII